MRELYDIYLDAFVHNVGRYKECLDQSNSGLVNPNNDYIKKAAYYGVKTVITKPQSTNRLNKAATNFEFVEVVSLLLSTMIPKEFIEIFPIDKRYDGAKYEMKDYYYTIDYMNTLDPLKPIGGEINKLLWEYQNMDIRLFNVRLLGYLDDMRNLRGQPNVIDELLNSGVPEKVVEKEYPSYLKLLK